MAPFEVIYNPRLILSCYRLVSMY